MAPATPAPGGFPLLGRRLDHFEVLEPIGQGGFGEVYKARDTRLDRLVALKTLSSAPAGDDQRHHRFRREAKAASALNHPNICTIHHIGEAEGVTYLVMELIEGGTLRDRARSAPLPAVDLLRIAIQIADGLAEAHRHQLIHRDIKPSNLGLTRTGQVKILDFGLAKSVPPAAGAADAVTLTALTEPGMVAGTPQYMAPEQVRGESVDARSDLFALGIVLYELATGRRPFAGQSLHDVREAIVHQPAAPASRWNPDLPRRFERILDRLLAKDPDVRFESASELGAELSGTLAEVLASPSSATAPTRRVHRRFGSARIGIGVLGLAALLAAVGWRARSHRAGADASAARSVARAGAAAPARLARQELRLARLGVDAELPRRLRQSAVGGILGGCNDDAVRFERLDDRTLAVSAPADELANCVSAVRIRDDLEGYRFQDEPSLFLDGIPSRRKVHFSIHGFPAQNFIFLIASATGFPVVLDATAFRTSLVAQAPPPNAAADTPVRPSELTLDIDGSSWDVALEAIIERLGLLPYHVGGVWLLTSRERILQLRATEPLIALLARPARADLARLREALAAARSDRGLVLVNRRLGAILIVDREEALAASGRVWRALDGTDLWHQGSLVAGARRRYDGKPVDLELVYAQVGDVLRWMHEFSGLDFVIDPSVMAAPSPSSMVTLWVHDVPWDNVLEAMLLAERLTYARRDRLVEVLPEAESSSELAVAERAVVTVELEREDTAFFVPLSGCLGPAGRLVAEPRSRTLVLSGPRTTTGWLERLATGLDRLEPADQLGPAVAPSR